MLVRVSLRFKITLLVVALVAVAGAGFSYTAFRGIKDVLMRSVGLGTLTAVEALAETVDGRWLERVNPAEVATDPSYQKLRGHFRRFVVDDIFVFAQLVRIDPANRRVVHIVNLHQLPAAEYSPGSEESFGDLPIYGSNEPGYEPIALDDLPGVYMAGWAPVYSDRQEVIGQMMAAVDMSNIVKVSQNISMIFLVAILLLIAVSGSAAYAFATNFEKAAVTDGLMGIYNHKYFKQRIEEEVAKSKRYGQQTSLVLFDIDFFKRVNDTYGHATGDLVLKLMAKWVTEMCRNTDVVCRYGGEEIACILPHTGIAGAQEFAERLRLKIAQQVVRDPEEEAEFRVTVSVGVAQWEKGMEFMDMIKAADAALYHSKGTGRNRVTVYHEELLPAPGNMASKPERTKEKRL